MNLPSVTWWKGYLVGLGVGVLLFVVLPYVGMAMV